jgi:hypothetical protein
MNRNSRKQTLAMVCATAVTAVAAMAAPVAPKVSFVVKGKLMTQAASGGAVRAATAAEKNKWRKPPMVSAISPNGKYEIRQTIIQNEADRYTSFKVSSRYTGSTIFQQDAPYFDGRAGLIFDYWLPDSQHIAIAERGGTSSGYEYDHYIININTGKAIPFNGWITPNGKSAIVPDKEYKMDDCICSGIDTIGIPAGSHNGDRKWYVAQLPKGFSSYHFNSATKRLITGAGAWDEPAFVGPKHEMGTIHIRTKPTDWFRFTAYVFSTFASKGGREDVTQGAQTLYVLQPQKIAHSPVVEFSRDSRWAIGNGNNEAYLISMTTGKVRKLPGAQAHFTN